MFLRTHSSDTPAGHEANAASQLCRSSRLGRPLSVDKVVLTMAQMYVVKRDGSQEEVKFDTITQRLRPLCEGLDASYIDPVPVTQKVIEGFYPGIATAEVDTLAAETCAYMSQKHPDFSILAARIAVSNLHKNTSGSFFETCKLLHDYVDRQAPAAKSGTGRPEPLLAEEVFDFVKANAEALDAAVDYTRDFGGAVGRGGAWAWMGGGCGGYDYFGFKTLEKSYLLRVGKRTVERPQHMLMRAACGIHCGDLPAALETYDLMSRTYATTCGHTWEGRCAWSLLVDF
eukprot:Skav215012  [mRNA]  locus=scaffold966:33995:37279:+ [translate_table: standard]